MKYEKATLFSMISENRASPYKRIYPAQLHVIGPLMTTAFDIARFSGRVRGDSKVNLEP